MNQLRVVTYNIEFGRPERIEVLHAVLAQLNADVITLNEADHEPVVAELAKRLNMQYVWARGSGDRHVATMSRFAILDWEIHNTKPLTQAALVTRLDVYPFGPEPLTVYNIHLRPDPFWHFELFRWLAVNKLLRVIAGKPPGPHLLMGDFNTYAPGDPIEIDTIARHMIEADYRMLRLQRFRFLRIALRRLLQAGYVDCYRRVHPTKPGYTFTRHGHPVNRMDFILSDRRLAPLLTRCDVVSAPPQAAIASDHFPLLAEFEP